jgi:Zn-finger nucleic acid-binding protein
MTGEQGMKCPRDGTPLERVRLLRVDLDKCHACDGLWCDAGEIEQLISREMSQVEEALERKYGDPDVTATDVGGGTMQCPRCEAPLQHYAYAGIVDVELDRCESCAGVWLDTGELDAILSSVPQEDAEAQQACLSRVLRKVAGLFRG